MTTKNFEHGDTPDTPSVDWLEHRDERQLCADLLAGTDAMRARRSVYTPRKPGEKVQVLPTGAVFDPYDYRVNMGSLTELFGDTVRKLSRMPFKHEIVIDKLPAELEYLRADVDGQRTPLAQFARQLFEDVLSFGVTIGNVDYSRDEASLAGEQITLDEVKQQRQRAKFQRFPILTVREHKTATAMGGLTRVRVVEYRTERVDGKQFQDTSVPYVRLYEVIDTDESDGESNIKLVVYRYDKDMDDWFVESDDPAIFPSTTVRLPMTVIGELSDRPPLQALAQTNLRHYQSSLANIHALDVGRFAIFVITGVDPQPGQLTPDNGPRAQDVILGPSIVIQLPTGQEAKFEEPAGSALKLGIEDVRALEDQAERQGAQPLARETGVKTATGVESDENRTMTPAQEMVGAVSRGLTQMFHDAAAYHGITLPDDFAVRIFDDFGRQVVNADVLRIMLDAVDKGKLRESRLIEAFQSFGVLDDDADVDEEVALLLSENQAKMDAMMERMDRQSVDDDPGLTQQDEDPQDGAI